MKLSELEEGDRVLFNDRSKPLKVESVGEDEVTVSGPGGGEYEIYLDGDALLICRKGNRRYSSYCEDLREVGEWDREGDEWTHSQTGAIIRLEKNENGYWTVDSDRFEADNPRYGFSSREFAEEEAEKIIEDNPDG
jgi:hypothetical protein